MSEELNAVECLQGSGEWFAARIGHLTSSRIDGAVRHRKRASNGKSKDDELQCRIDLRLELATERITNKISENYVSYWMQRGTELEPLARAAYELRTGRETQQVGFVMHNSILWAGCSPDGLVGDDGLVEFKVPKPTTHTEYLIADVVPEIYRPQMLWQLACCPERRWNEFVSWCPDFPEPLDLFICRLERDDVRIGEMEREAEKFLAEVDATVAHIREGMEGTLKRSVRRLAAI